MTPVPIEIPPIARLLLLLTAVGGWAGCGAAGETRCTESASCPNGTPIRMCVDGEGSACRNAWLELGGETYACAGCGDCQGALQSALPACASVSPGDGGPGSAQRISIPALRDPAAPGRPAYGARVEVEGAIVTAVKLAGNSHSFTIQDPTTSRFGGLYVYLGSAQPTVTPGAVVRVSGTFKAFRKLEEISLVEGGSYTQTGTAPLPTPIPVSPAEINNSGPRTAELQSMLLRLENVVASSSTKGTDFTVTAPSGASLVVTSFIANDTGPSPFPATPGQTYSSIIGVGYVTGPQVGPFTAKLAPRSAADVHSP